MFLGFQRLPEGSEIVPKSSRQASWMSLGTKDRFGGPKLRYIRPKLRYLGCFGPYVEVPRAAANHPREPSLGSLGGWKALGALLGDKTRRCTAPRKNTVFYLQGFRASGRPRAAFRKASGGLPKGPGPGAPWEPKARPRRRAASSKGAFSSIFERSGLASGPSQPSAIRAP